MSVAVITVNWNGWELTRQCVADVRKSRYSDLHIYIVDNGSTDGSVEHLAGLGDGVTLIAHGRNGGWAGGNNVGIRQALADGHEFLLLLNNDAVPAEDAIDHLLAAHARIVEMGGALAPVLGAVEQRSEGFGFVKGMVDEETGIPGWIPAEENEEALADQLIETSYVNGAALFVHRSVFEHVGLFDERFFLYFDETDWCFRARREGHPLLIVRQAMIHHEGGATMGGVGSPLQHYFMIRNRLLFAEKHCTPEQKKKVAALNRKEAAEIRDGDPALKQAFHQGTLDYAQRRFGDCPPEIRDLRAEPSDEDQGGQASAIAEET